MAARYILLILSVIYALDNVHGHGMVIEPPNRSSMWRYQKEFPQVPFPQNYQDNQEFCGGFQVQFEQNDGKCGICGDDYGQARPRDNEHGGKYGLGIIARQYYEDSNIQVIVKITASHKGQFTFSLCNMDVEEESEECFERNPLKLINGSDSFHVDKDLVTEYPVYLSLPKGLTCEHCVLRWQYRAGNNWGYCSDGTSGLGCGPQETFRTCSDISIIPTEKKQLHVKDEVVKKVNLLISKFNSLKNKEV